jgi:hypothetical protein
MGSRLDGVKEDSKVLSIPLERGYVNKNWSYFGPDILSWITKKPLIYKIDEYGLSVENKKNIQIIPKSYKTYSLNNVGYLLFQKDTVYSYKYKDLNLGDLLIRNDYFDLYKISDEYFLPHIYSSTTSTVVVGDIEALVPMSYTTYLDGKPTLLFTKRMEERKDIGLLENRDIRFVFKDSNWQDLAVGLSQKLELRDQKLEIKVEEKGNYELWLDYPVIQGDERIISELKVKIDGKRVSLLIRSLKGEGTKWKRIGEVYLEKGTHRIEIQNLEMENKEVGLFLLRKDEFENTEKGIQEIINKSEINLGYLFSKIRNNLINRYFYVPRDSEYTVKAQLSPNFVGVETLESKGLNFNLGLPEEFKKWSFKPSGVTYNYFISEPGILTLSLYLDGDSEEDEYVQMRKEKITVDLKKHPWLNLTYKIEDPKVQTIEVVLGIDFDKDKVVDEYVRGICPRRAVTEFDKFSYNVLAKVKRDFPDEEYYNLVELEIYPHKIWGVDCKSLEKRGKYKFYIRDLQFCNYTYKTFFKVIENALESDLGEKGEFNKWKVTSNLKDYSYNLQNENLVVTAKFEAEVDKSITLTRSFENLNLERFPFIEFEYKVDDSLFQILEVILSLDFDEDGVVDKDIFSSLSIATTFEKFKFNAFKVAKEAYPDKREYRLLQLRLRLREGRKNFLGFARKGDYSWYFKNIRIYSTSFVLPVDFAFNKPVFEIDEEEYWFEKKFKNKEEVENALFSEKLYLKKGEHSISNLLKEKDNFKVDWIIIEPLASQCLAKEEPKITFRRVNPTKYEVKIEEAKEPFWLIFSENFHKGWNLCSSQSTVPNPQSFGEIVADYPKLKVKEAKHLMKFTPLDIRYLFWKADIKEHYLVNGYANGWYVEPGKLGLGENFTLILYFWPQSLFYLGLGISGITFIGCIGYLVKTGIRRKQKKLGDEKDNERAENF